MINWDLTAGTLQHCQCQQIPVNVGRFDDIPTEERGHLQLLLQQRIPQNCWPNYSKFPNEIQSKQIIEIWDGIIEVVHQELYGNLNIWGLVIWQTFWPLLFFLSNTISYKIVLIILKCFSHNHFLPTKKSSPKKAEIFRNVYIINFHI